MKTFENWRLHGLKDELKDEMYVKTRLLELSNLEYDGPGTPEYDRVVELSTEIKEYYKQKIMSAENKWKAFDDIVDYLRNEWKNTDVIIFDLTSWARNQLKKK